MQETWIQSLGWEDPLEKEVATHSSILAWRIPWTEEPGGLQSMESQRVGHNSDFDTHLHYICYGCLWSVTFDVTNTIVSGHHKPLPHKTVNLTDKWCVCYDNSSDPLFPWLSLLLRPPYSLRHDNIEMRPINNLTTASSCSTEKRSQWMLQTSLLSCLRNCHSHPNIQ